MIEKTVIQKSPETRRALVGKTGRANPADRSIEIVVSTSQVDRDGEIVLPSAFKGCGRFLASHAPWMAQHTYRSADGSPTQIGWVTSLDVQSDRVVGIARFAKTSTAEDWWILASDPDGRGIGASIGFWPKEVVRGTVAAIREEYPELTRSLAGMADSDVIRVYTELDLGEISACGVPANPGCSQVMAAKDLAEAPAVRDLTASPEFAAAVRAECDRTLPGLVAAAVADRMEGYDARIQAVTDELMALVPDTIHGDASDDGHAPAGGATDLDVDGDGDDGARELSEAAAALAMAAG